MDFNCVSLPDDPLLAEVCPAQPFLPKRSLLIPPRHPLGVRLLEYDSNSGEEGDSGLGCALSESSREYRTFECGFAFSVSDPHESNHGKMEKMNSIPRFFIRFSRGRLVRAPPQLPFFLFWVVPSTSGKVVSYQVSLVCMFLSDRDLRGLSSFLIRSNCFKVSDLRCIS